MQDSSLAQSIASAAHKPLVSIIVPTLNRELFLERCIRSILDQTYRNIECVVVDGASKDSSLTILSRLAETDSRLRFISEPDEGEVYAVNKGLDLATGDVVGVLNSDDYYVPDAVESSVDFLLAHPEYIGVSGDARYVDKHGQPLNRGVITYRGEMSKRRVKRIIILRYKSTPVCHGSFFGWRLKLRRHGQLDPVFSVMPDLEFYLRLLDAGERIGCLPRVQYNFTIHPGMGALRHAAKVEQQRALVHQRFGLRWYDNLLWMTVGRVASYVSNPYRAAFWDGVKWELEMWYARTLGRRTQADRSPQ